MFQHNCMIWSLSSPFRVYNVSCPTSQANSGFFRENCSEPTINPNQTANAAVECPSQNSQMNQIYTISAVICNFSTFFFGYLMDKWGTWCSRTVACLMVSLGSLLLFLSSPEKSKLLVLGMYILSAGKYQLTVLAKRNSKLRRYRVPGDQHANWAAFPK